MRTSPVGAPVNMNLNMHSLHRKLLSKPLSVSMRHRLEIAFSMVVAAAAIVGLSRVIRPDPSKLISASAITNAMPFVLRPDEPRMRPETPPPPKVDPEFINAVSRGDLKTMEKLYTKGMPLDETLSAAADLGDQAVVQWLLDRGADVHEGEDSPHAPILMADAHADVVALLLARGAKEPSLTAAAIAGAENSVAHLLTEHVAVNPAGESPLADAVTSTRASGETKKRIAEMLLAAKANPNREGMTNNGSSLRALTAAVFGCDMGLESDDSGDGEPPSAPTINKIDECLVLIKLLVKHGARADGDTLNATIQLNDRIREPILDAVLTAPIEHGATATALAQMQFESNPLIVTKIVAKGVDWGWHDGEDDAALPLVAAVRSRHHDTVRLLILSGAPVDRRYKDGVSALGAAIEQITEDSPEDARLVELLIAHGADVNHRLPDGRTPLFAAAEAGNIRVINDLLDRGARVDERVLDDTALNGAEQKGHLPAARVLHARGGHRAPFITGRGWGGQGER